MDKKDKEELKKAFGDQIKQLRKDMGALQKAVKSLKETGLNENLLAYIIQQSAKRFHTGTPVNLKFIKFILQGIEDIDVFVFPREE